MKYLFVGEARSNRARQLNLTWKDGGLAAKPLFEALIFAGINPIKCQFVNLFEPGGAKTVKAFAGRVVGMGQKVQNKLTQLKIKHVAYDDRGGVQFLVKANNGCWCPFISKRNQEGEVSRRAEEFAKEQLTARRKPV